MNAAQLAALRSTAKAYVRAQRAGDDNWIPAHHEPAELILNDLHKHGLIDDDGRVTAEGRKSFSFSQI